MQASTTAWYTLRWPAVQALTGHCAMRVVDSCRKGSLGGMVRMAKGKATVADPTRNARFPDRGYDPGRLHRTLQATVGQPRQGIEPQKGHKTATAATVTRRTPPYRRMG